MSDGGMMAQQLIRIRDLKREEMRTVLDIEYRSFKDPYPLSLLDRLHAMHPDGFLVAELQNKVVGYVIGVIRWGFTGHILTIAVDPPYRRQGVGTALAANIVDRIRTKGAKQVRLEVRRSNLAARQFYLKLGFAEREEIPNYYEDGETAVIMNMNFDKI
jgi:ribosomal-protein-alanine N-acetyltransferase